MITIIIALVICYVCTNIHRLEHFPVGPSPTLCGIGTVVLIVGIVVGIAVPVCGYDYEVETVNLSNISLEDAVPLMVMGTDEEEIVYYKSKKLYNEELISVKKKDGVSFKINIDKKYKKPVLKIDKKTPRRNLFLFALIGEEKKYQFYVSEVKYIK